MMSFESFRSLAINHPCTVEPSVYRVDVFRINGPVDKMPCRNLSLGLFNVHVHVDDRDDAEYYPEYNVCKAQSFVMPTFEDAKEFIQSGRISIDDDRPVYCIHIYELPFGKDVISDLCKREWVFDGNCSIINQSVCSSLLEDLDTPEGHFWGRPKETIRFSREILLRFMTGKKIPFVLRLLCHCVTLLNIVGMNILMLLPSVNVREWGKIMLLETIGNMPVTIAMKS